MDAQRCAITNRVTTDAVYSPTTQLVYDRGTLLAALSKGETCPVTGKKVDRAELLAVRTVVGGAHAVPPRGAAEATSVPGLLSLLQAEWDSTAVETFKLRAALEASRRETSEALFQLDACKRVIHRLLGEKEELQRALGSGSTAKLSGAAADEAPQAAPAPTAKKNGAPAVPKPTPLTSAEKKKITDTMTEHTSLRKKRKATAPASGAWNWTHASVSSGLAAALESATAFDARGRWAVVGQSSGKVVASEVLPTAGLTERQYVAKPKANVAVTAVRAFGDDAGGVVAGFADGTVAVWANPKAGFVETETPVTRGVRVCGVSVHPTGDFACAVGADGSWGMFRLGTGKLVMSHTGEGGGEEERKATPCVDVHPDGSLVAVSNGVDGAVQVWSLTEEKVAATLEAKDEVVKAFRFASNGTHLVMLSAAATGKDKSIVTSWDLRRPDAGGSRVSLPAWDGAVSALVECDRVDKSGLSSGSFLMMGVAANGTTRVASGGKEWVEVAAPASLATPAGKGAFVGAAFASGKAWVVSSSSSSSSSSGGGGGGGGGD